jgi:formimidoylglutamate deiminase
MMPRFIVSDSGQIDANPQGVDEDMLTLPGFINVHSHAFQRVLRGRVERRPEGAGKGSFWTWREAMYRAANALTVDDVRTLATWAYRDMVRAGFVAVGEFHYLHDAPSLDAALAMTRAMVDAARATGIHLCLLETAYETSAFHTPALPEQRRFVFSGDASFLDFQRAVAREYRGAEGVSIGLALHSVRACPASLIEAVANEAKRTNVPLHIHACEQRKEVHDCVEAHGMSPIAWLDQHGALGPNTTLIHATHLDDADIARIAERGASVCLTPSTERNLGDGLARIGDMHRAGIALSIGTDSHARIDPLDELRALDEQERLRVEERNPLAKPGQRLAEVLMPIGTKNGRRALGLREDQRGIVNLRLPLEGRAGSAEDGLEALLISGTSHDVAGVMSTQGKRLTLAEDDDALDREVLAILRRLRAQ